MGKGAGTEWCGLCLFLRAYGTVRASSVQVSRCPGCICCICAPAKDEYHRIIVLSYYPVRGQNKTKIKYEMVGGWQLVDRGCISLRDTHAYAYTYHTHTHTQHSTVWTILCGRCSHGRSFVHMCVCSTHNWCGSGLSLAG